MKLERSLHYAVITGDIVESSRLSASDRRRLVGVIGESSRELRKIFGKIVPLDVDVFRGDSWQVLLTDPPRSLRAALAFRALLRWKMESQHFDTRLAIGIGAVDLIPGRRVSEGSGEAFRASGLALDAMKKRRMSFAFPGSDVEKPLDVVIHLIDEIAVRWTDRQAKAIVGSLQGWTQKKIARTWGSPGISQPAVTHHLEAAGWHAVHRGVSGFEQILDAALGQEPGSDKYK
jgi:hypothetical protein